MRIRPGSNGTPRFAVDVATSTRSKWMLSRLRLASKPSSAKASSPIAMTSPGSCCPPSAARAARLATSRSSMIGRAVAHSKRDDRRAASAAASSLGNATSSATSAPSRAVSDRVRVPSRPVWVLCVYLPVALRWDHNGVSVAAGVHVGGEHDAGVCGSKLDGLHGFTGVVSRRGRRDGDAGAGENFGGVLAAWRLRITEDDLGAYRPEPTNWTVTPWPEVSRSTGMAHASTTPTRSGESSPSTSPAPAAEQDHTPLARLQERRSSTADQPRAVPDGAHPAARRSATRPVSSRGRHYRLSFPGVWDVVHDMAEVSRTGRCQRRPG
jgi:hypothetical protein